MNPSSKQKLSSKFTFDKLLDVEAVDSAPGDKLGEAWPSGDAGINKMFGALPLG